MARRRALMRPEDATNEGSRCVRVLLRRMTFGALARRLRCDERSIRRYAREEQKPDLIMRARAYRELAIPEDAWDEAPRTDPYDNTEPSTRRA